MSAKGTEIEFAKSFLLTLSNKPISIPFDHVEDLRKLPPRSLFTLPKLPTTLTKPTPTDPSITTSTASSQPSATIHLKTLRPPSIINETLQNTPLSTLITSLKSTVSEKTGVPVNKIRLMIKGKILSDGKRVEEIVEDGGEVVISVMVIGGFTPQAATPAEGVKKEEEEGTSDTTKVAQVAETAETVEEAVKMDIDTTEDEESVKRAREVLKTDSFLDDLEVFVKLKAGSESVAKEAREVFRKAWSS